MTSTPAPEGQRHRLGRPWRRLGRVLGWLGLGALGVTLLLAGGLAVLLRLLDHPAVKQQVQRLVRDAAAIELDYGRTRLRLRTGLRIDDLLVRAPPGDRDLSPELLRLGSLEVEWSLPRLLGRGPVLQAVIARGLALSVVRDADGQTTLTRLTAGRPEDPRRPTPLSQVLAQQLAHAPPVRRRRLVSGCCGRSTTPHASPASPQALRPASASL